DAGVEVFFRQIALTKSVFISRGDQSGTHEKELELWSHAKIAPEERNIINGGSMASNKECIGISLEKSAYTLVDSTSYKLSEHKNDLRIYAGNRSGIDPGLDNIFSAIAVSRLPQDSARYSEAVRFINWLTGPEARSIIEGYLDREGQEPYFHLIY
ncbi:MAG TPA: substrate-binding domain-containing protein, partial [Tissierellaceae bacterium]|nr:substrate-binding domain-containing protein [Tissierellaceae bacterium]